MLENIIITTILFSLSETSDDKKRIKMILNGLPNPGRLAEIINSHREEIARACKDSLIELDEAFEGSLILHLFVQQRLFYSDSELHKEIDSFLEIVFTAISFKPEITTNNYIVILNDGKLWHRNATLRFC